MSRKRLRLPLSMLGSVRELGGHTWVWECGLLPCPLDTQRREPQLSRGTAEGLLVEHLRAYHGATGGDVRGTQRPPPRCPAGAVAGSG